MRPFLRRVWYAIRQRQFEADLAEELEFHRTMKQQELEARGDTSTDAERATRRALGSLALANDHVRDIWTWSWLQDLSQDVRFATRLLAKDRRFTLAAVVALALGIGAMNGAFTAVNAFLIRGLPLDRPEQIVALRTFDTHGRELGSSYLDYQDWRHATRTFVDMAAELGAPMTLTEESRAAERVQASYISVNLFRLLGRAPMQYSVELFCEDLSIESPLLRTSSQFNVGMGGLAAYLRFDLRVRRETGRCKGGYEQARQLSTLRVHLNHADGYTFARRVRDNERVTDGPSGVPQELCYVREQVDRFRVRCADTDPDRDWRRGAQRRQESLTLRR